MQGFYVPKNKSWMDTQRLLPPLSSQCYSEYPDRNLTFSVGSCAWFFSHCIWPQQPNPVLAVCIVGSCPACLRNGSEMGLFEIPRQEWSERPENQLHEECPNKSSPSLNQFIWLFLSCRLWSCMHTSQNSLISSLIILMALRGEKTPVKVQWFWFLSTSTRRHLWNNYELWVNVNWRWEGREALTNAARPVMLRLCVLNVSMVCAGLMGDWKRWT